MAERIDVMISSTARDLPEYRQQAMDAAVRQGMFPIMMEHLPAMDDDAVSASLAMVEEAEIYLGIVARRYGYIPAGYDISITEMEYNHAAQRGIPRLIFLMDEDYDFDSPAEAPSAQGKLAAFKARLEAEQVVNYFSSPADLRAQIIHSLSRYHTRSSQPLHRFSPIPPLPEPYIAHPYTLLESGKLFGRRAELDLLAQWAAGASPALQDVRVMGLVAIGGMGKSALTWKWFNDIAPQMLPLRGRVWWSFYERDSRYENFITRSLAYLSQQPEDALRRLSFAERESEVLRLLDSEPYLLVLDGLERLLVAYSQHGGERLRGHPGTALTDSILSTKALGGQHRLRKSTDPRVGNFLRKLANLDASRVLLSTRLYPAALETPAGTEVPGSYHLTLPGLEDEDALELWRSFGVSGSRRALLKLFRAFDNYPLLIRALAGEVARYRRAPGSFDRWQRANRQFNPFNLPLVQQQSHVLQYALAGLSEQHLEVLRVVAAFSSPLDYDTLVEVLLADIRDGIAPLQPLPRTAPIFESEYELDAALTELEDRGVLGWDRGANRYDMHPVVRGVVWNDLSPEAQAAIYERLRVHLASLPAIENWREVQHLEELAPSIELYRTLIGLRRYDDACDLLMSRLYRPLRYRLSSGQQFTALLEMLFPQGVEALPDLSNPADQAWALNALGQAYQMVGQPGRAAPLFRRSNQLKENASYTVDLSVGLRDLSYALRLCGALRDAEAAARRALAVDRADDNPLQEALDLQVLGLALAAQGAELDSATALDRSLALAESTNANRPYNHQALRALWFGDFAAAQDWAQRAWHYCQRRGLEAGSILALRLQGQIALRLGEINAAEDRLHQALAHARSVILVEEEIAALIALAEVNWQRGRVVQALELLDEVQDAIEQGPYRLYHADAENLRAQIFADQGDNVGAEAAARHAYQLAWCDGVPYAYMPGIVQAQHLLSALGAALPALPPYDEAAHDPMPDQPIVPA